MRFSSYTESMFEYRHFKTFANTFIRVLKRIRHWKQLEQKKQREYPSPEIIIIFNDFNF